MGGKKEISFLQPLQCVSWSGLRGFPTPQSHYKLLSSKFFCPGFDLIWLCWTPFLPVLIHWFFVLWRKKFWTLPKRTCYFRGGKKPTFILYSDCLWLVKWSIRGNSPVEENLLGSRYWTAKLWASQVTIGNINYALKIAKGFGGVKKATDHHWERLMALAKERKHFFSFLNEDKSCNDSNCPEVHICVWEREVPC